MRLSSRQQMQPWWSRLQQQQQPQPPQHHLIVPPQICMPFIPNELPPRLAGMTELQYEQLCAEHTEVAAQQWEYYEGWLRRHGYPVPESRADN